MMKRTPLLSLLTVQSAVLLVVAACTEGTTPDCRSPDAGCAPGLDGSIVSEAGEGGATDAPIDTGSDSAGEGGDASDAGSDARLDADAQGG